MSEKTRQHLSHDVIFHGKKEFGGTSVITGLNKIGYIQVKTTSGQLFIGGEGVTTNGFPLGADSEIIMTAASIDKIYAHGTGILNFIGGYSN